MLATGLMQGSGAARVGRRTRWTTLAVGLAVAAVSAAGVNAAVFQEQPADVGSLVDRLVELERELPPLPPDEVLLNEEETWGELTGDFTGAQVVLDTLAGEVRELYIAAEEAKPDPVATAVADAARSILILQEGYTLLAEVESYDLSFPVDGTDDLDVATGADQAYGLAEAGLRLVLDAHARRLPAFQVLQDSELVDDTERAFFEALYDAEVAFDSDLRPDIHRLLSLDTTQVMRTIDRFTSVAPGTEARARSMTVVCLAREAYLEGDVAGLGIPEELIALGHIPADDCPALTSGAESRLVDR